MSATLQQLGIDQLPAAKKLALVNELLDIVAADNSTSLNGSLPLHAQLPPLRVEEGGVIRVGKTRISLDLIVEQYENGMTPEDMVRAYDSLKLEDVHAVIAYYLRHTNEVRAYVKRRVEEADALQAKIEAESPPITRSELLARRAAKSPDDEVEPVIIAARESDRLRRLRELKAVSGKVEFDFDGQEQEALELAEVEFPQ